MFNLWEKIWNIDLENKYNAETKPVERAIKKLEKMLEKIEDIQ